MVIQSGGLDMMGSWLAVLPALGCAAMTLVCARMMFHRSNKTSTDAASHADAVTQP
jgi:hypothetical protein